MMKDPGTAGILFMLALTTGTAAIFGTILGWLLFL